MLVLGFMMFLPFFVFVLPVFIMGLMVKNLKNNQGNNNKEDKILANALKERLDKLKYTEESYEDNCEGSSIVEKLLKDWNAEEEKIEEAKVEVKNHGDEEGIFEGLSDEEILVVASEIFQSKY